MPLIQEFYTVQLRCDRCAKIGDWTGSNRQRCYTIAGSYNWDIRFDDLEADDPSSVVCDKCRTEDKPFEVVK